MSTQILDNQRRSLLAHLEESLPQAQSLRIAVAFVKTTGIELLKAGISGLLSREGRFEIVFGLDFVLTEPKAIQGLLKFQKTYPNAVTCRAYADYQLRDIPNFHPKLYILETSDDSISFTVGSSNLTAGGLRNNVELNLAVVASQDDPLAVSANQTFLKLLTQNAAFLPNDEYLHGYEAAYNAYQRRGREAVRDPGVQGVLAQLKQLEPPLRRASKTQVEIVRESVAELTRTEEYAHLRDITALARQKAETLGIEYDWTTFENSVRGRLNENVVGKKTGLEVFQRPGNRPGTGLYRLASKTSDS